jgi:peptide deformylase
MITTTLDWEASRSHEIGAALAAVQIAELWRVVVIRNDFDNKDDRSFSVFINPEIVKAEGDIVEELEGCLSVKDIYGSVPRHTKVKIKALNLEGKPVRLTAPALARKHTNRPHKAVFVDRIADLASYSFN